MINQNIDQIRCLTNLNLLPYKSYSRQSSLDVFLNNTGTGTVLTNNCSCCPDSPPNQSNKFEEEVEKLYIDANNNISEEKNNENGASYFCDIAELAHNPELWKDINIINFGMFGKLNTANNFDNFSSSCDLYDLFFVKPGSAKVNDILEIKYTKKQDENLFCEEDQF